MTNSIDDLGQADVILVIGSNTTEAHPIIGIELKKAARTRHAHLRGRPAPHPRSPTTPRSGCPSSRAPTSRSSTR